jgi:competence protein ComEA
MDHSAAPWHVLDDSAPAHVGGADAESAPRPASSITVRLVLGLVVAAGLAVGAFVLAATGPAGSVEIGSGAWASGEPGPIGSDQGLAAGELVVDVQGAVLRPGVQRLAPGARVGDAIAAAGGYGPRVDAARAATELNLAALVADGDRIVVPARGDAAPGSSQGGGGGSGASGLVNVNTASASELDALPGIGPVTAQKIIDARAEQPFASVDELRDRKVVGAATFEKLRDLVTVR